MIDETQISEALKRSMDIGVREDFYKAAISASK
jgi:hypothetical protein